mmetsp:Transcript_6494/g.11976  ORF Transcript_6494/g.11976 Transcript_6494/m.11976 type:complete len:107 (+) Transcript_6494:29-349(+)
MYMCNYLCAPDRYIVNEAVGHKFITSNSGGQLTVKPSGCMHAALLRLALDVHRGCACSIALRGELRSREVAHYSITNGGSKDAAHSKSLNPPARSSVATAKHNELS